VPPSRPVRPPRAYRVAAEPVRTAPAAPIDDPPTPVRRAPRLGRALLALAVVVVLVVLLQQLGERSAPPPVSLWGGGTGAGSASGVEFSAATGTGTGSGARTAAAGPAFARLHEGRPVAFDPCTPIHFVTRYDGAPPGADALVQAAVAQLSAATGLVLIHDGDFDETPSGAREPRQPERYGDRWAPVLISWSSADLGATTSPVAVDPDGRGPRLVSGQVVVDAAARDPAAAARALRHELAVVVGLAPSGAPHADSGVATGYSPDELRALEQLGEGPCLR
jgi:hypothetical protein